MIVCPPPRLNWHPSSHSFVAAIVIGLAGPVLSHGAPSVALDAEFDASPRRCKVIIRSSASSVALEAESGALGSDWTASGSSSPAYITISSNLAGNAPGNSARVATYTVTFPADGVYHLYVRVRVGPGIGDDDSFFYGNGFGAKSPTAGSDWVLVNNLWNVGFTNPADVVTGAGTAGARVWKWINLSRFTAQPGFAVSAGHLTQTFQIGGREDGLELDKFVFGAADSTLTVADLDEAGSATPMANPGVADWNEPCRRADDLRASPAWALSWNPLLLGGLR
jgi:hypothetical protein